MELGFQSIPTEISVYEGDRNLEIIGSAASVPSYARPKANWLLKPAEAVRYHALWNCQPNLVLKSITSLDFWKASFFWST